MARTTSTPCVPMTARYARSASTVRPIAAGSSLPVASTPWPRRVICIRRSTVVIGPPGAARATRRRVELVPQSIAATVRVPAT